MADREPIAVNATLHATGHGLKTDLIVRAPISGAWVRVYVVDSATGATIGPVTLYVVPTEAELPSLTPP